MQNFIAKLTDNQRKIFYIMVGVVALALLDRLFLGPVLDKIQATEDEIAQQKEDIRRDIKFLDYSDRIVKNSQAVSKYFSKPGKDEDVINAEFLSLIERLASAAKVNITKSNPSDTKKEKNSSQYSANLDCSGQLKDVVSFMHSINTSDELLKVIRFNMAAKRGSEGDVNASMTIVKLIVSPDASDSSATSSKK